MAWRKPTNGPRSVMRTDLLLSNMTATKETQVRGQFSAYRWGAMMLATATRKDRVGWWLSLSTMSKAVKIAVPLLTGERHKSRGGRLCKGVLVTEKRNRGIFRCLWCSSRMHADVNAARNIGPRRALSIGSVFQSKAAIFAELVRQFSERRGFSTRSGGRGSTADPRRTNSYFGGTRTAAARMSGQTRASDFVLTISTR